MKKILLIGILLLCLVGCSGKSGGNKLKVLSDSMNPTIKYGDTVIYEKIEFDSIQIGDIVVCNVNNNMVTHRVIDINQNEQGKYLTLKGDNNQIADAEKYYEDSYIGKVTSIK